jgi:hypothetical protein
MQEIIIEYYDCKFSLALIIRHVTEKNRSIAAEVRGATIRSTSLATLQETNFNLRHMMPYYRVIIFTYAIIGIKCYKYICKYIFAQIILHEKCI